MKRFAIATLFVASAAGISFLIRPLLSDFPALSLMFFLLAVAATARYCGYRASLYSLAVCTIVLNFYSVASVGGHSVLTVAFARSAVFFGVGLFLCLLIRSLREAKAARSRLAAIVDHSDDAIISKDLDGNVTSWNSGAEKLFGFSEKEMLGGSLLRIIPPELHSQEDSILERLKSGMRIDHFETERVRNDGSRVRVSLTMSPIMDREGRVIGASKIARDVTDRVRMQEAFIQSEKLAATGRMAAAIAHEINNPLEAVTNLAFLISTNPSLDSSGKHFAELLLAEINRVSEVAKRSLTYFRDTGKPAAFDLCALIGSVLDLNKPLFAQKNLTVRRELPGSCEVFGSASELRQVMFNLVRNAIDATGERGKVRVRVRSQKGSWRISVGDDGQGIPLETLHRLFQPFLTSKGATGNGLGLWISRGIVEKHGGEIKVRSCSLPGRSWTVFSVLLPKSGAAVQSGPAQHSGLAVPAQSAQ